METDNTPTTNFARMVTVSFVSFQSFTATTTAASAAWWARARHHIHAHLDQSLPLAVVARRAGLSESHFCRVFREVTGWTLTDYITQCRIGWAQRELLRPSARISGVAFKVGFQSLSQFNRSFARVVGCSPSAYRNASQHPSPAKGAH